MELFINNKMTILECLTSGDFIRFLPRYASFAFIIEHFLFAFFVWKIFIGYYYCIVFSAATDTLRSQTAAPIFIT